MARLRCSVKMMIDGKCLVEDERAGFAAKLTPMLSEIGAQSDCCSLLQSRAARAPLGEA